MSKRSTTKTGSGRSNGLPTRLDTSDLEALRLSLLLSRQLMESKQEWTRIMSALGRSESFGGTNKRTRDMWDEWWNLLDCLILFASHVRELRQFLRSESTAASSLRSAASRKKAS